NLTQTPDWPILYWNLVEWRAAQAPGLREANVRLGAEVPLVVEAGTDAVELIEPDGSKRRVPVHGGVALAEAERPGVYRFGEHALAANALSADESDLATAAAGRWGGWPAPAAAEAAKTEQSLSGALLAAALVLLSAHGLLVSREARP